MQKKYVSVGLMSGTSGDGVDASIISSNGLDQFEVIQDKYFEYDSSIYKEIHQIKNKIFKGSNVEIRRTLNKVNPLINEFEDENLDSSIAKIQYLVKTDKNKDIWKIWTNILLSNELKSYCAPL